MLHLAGYSVCERAHTERPGSIASDSIAAPGSAGLRSHLLRRWRPISVVAETGIRPVAQV